MRDRQTADPAKQDGERELLPADPCGHRQRNPAAGRQDGMFRHHRSRPSSGRVWPGEEVLPGVPSPFFPAGKLQVRGRPLQSDHRGCEAVPTGVFRPDDPPGTPPERALRPAHGHRRLDGGPDAAGQQCSQRRHLPEPGTGDDPLHRRGERTGSPGCGAVRYRRPGGTSAGGKALQHGRGRPRHHPKAGPPLHRAPSLSGHGSGV